MSEVTQALRALVSSSLYPLSAHCSGTQEAQRQRLEAAHRGARVAHTTGYVRDKRQHAFAAPRTRHIVFVTCVIFSDARKQRERVKESAGVVWHHQHFTMRGADDEDFPVDYGKTDKVTIYPHLPTHTHLARQPLRLTRLAHSRARRCCAYELVSPGHHTAHRWLLCLSGRTARSSLGSPLTILMRCRSSALCISHPHYVHSMATPCCISVPATRVILKAHHSQLTRDQPNRFSHSGPARIATGWPRRPNVPRRPPRPSQARHELHRSQHVQGAGTPSL